ncbi:MAG: radical SAM protein [Agathobacter sp.]|nr:radical SAM protein [Agathobacter sp.]
MEKSKKEQFFEECNLCPRNCRANRLKMGKGICGVGQEIKVARAALHFWEEPCISGTRGSGAVFFSGCSLHCVFCQNEAIARGDAGKEIPRERLVEIFLELQEKGANNINLVTAGHYLPHIIWAVERARDQGLYLPIVYNTSSYEKVDSIRRLEGIVDVYLPDLKYFDSRLAERYSHAPDYPQVAMAAIREMVRQQPKATFMKEDKIPLLKEFQCHQDTVTQAKNFWSQEAEEGYIMTQGVIVRQLLLPGLLEDAKKIVSYLYQTYGDQIYLSLMSQFTPLPHVERYPELNRKVTRQEYDSYVDFAIDLGVEQGFIQEEDVAEESFIPDFDCEGV